MAARDLIVLACGSRDWANEPKVREVLDGLNPTQLVQGDARGADAMAKAWAYENHVYAANFPADWATHGRAAGAIRNKQMLDYILAPPGAAGPDRSLCVAFKTNFDWTLSRGGTENMVKQCIAAGVPVMVVS